MSSVNSVLSGTAVSSTAQASVDASLNSVKPNIDSKKMFNEAKPTISKVIAEIACGANSKQTARYTDPDAVAALQVEPTISMHYHKSGCLEVERISGVKKKSANAFSFLVTYTSPQSKESVRKGYTAIKQPEGDWLFKWSDF